MTTRHEGGIKDDKVDKATYITSTLGRNGNIYPRVSRKRPKIIPTTGKCLYVSRRLTIKVPVKK